MVDLLDGLLGRVTVPAHSTETGFQSEASLMRVAFSNACNEPFSQSEINNRRGRCKISVQKEAVDQMDHPACNLERHFECLCIRRWAAVAALLAWALSFFQARLQRPVFAKRKQQQQRCPRRRLLLSCYAATPTYSVAISTLITFVPLCLSRAAYSFAAVSTSLNANTDMSS